MVRQAGDSVTYFGGCFCRGVRYSVRGGASDLCFCHCNSCRRATGAIMVAWGTFAAKEFVVTSGSLAEIVSSPGVTRGHCAACGSSMTYRHEARGSDIDVTLATLDDAAAFHPEMHIWVQDKLPWVAIADGLPQHETVRG